jgi:cold shock CspA family protein
METKQKRLGILNNWNEPKGWGFVVARNLDGSRRSWFLHFSRIERIEEESGIPQVGAEVYFHEEENSRGPLAVDAEIKSVASIVARCAGVKALRGL